MIWLQPEQPLTPCHVDPGRSIHTDFQYGSRTFCPHRVEHLHHFDDEEWLADFKVLAFIHQSGKMRRLSAVIGARHGRHDFVRTGRRRGSQGPDEVGGDVGMGEFFWKHGLEHVADRDVGEAGLDARAEWPWSNAEQPWTMA